MNEILLSQINFVSIKRNTYLNAKQQKLILEEFNFISIRQKSMHKLPNGKMVYPEDIQCVHDPINGKGGIFIGNLEAAQNLHTLKKNGIKAVLTAAKGVFLTHCKSEIPFQLYIPGEDHERYDISKYFNQSVAFIRDTLQKTNILVHCLAGVSRSVSLVMAYLIKYHNMGYDQVYSKIKSRRRIIHPNDGFITQLRKFQCQCRQDGPVIQKHDMYEIRSSYSPLKRYERRGFEGYQPSPDKFYQSQKKIQTTKMNSTGYQKFQTNSGFNSVGQNINNPQLYRSIVEDLRKQRGYKETTQTRQFQPDRYQKQNRLNSSVGLKRLSSMTADLQRPSGNLKRSQLYSNYQRYEPRGRISSDYKPLESIQNRQFDMNCQIDRKIIQIRNKYQQYTRHSDTAQQRLDKMRVDRKYTNTSTAQSSSQKSSIDDLVDLKYRKTTSGYDQPRNDPYTELRIVRNNNYLTNEAPNLNKDKFMESRLRRLQSYQI